MSIRRRKRVRRDGAKGAAIDMNSLIDLTFLLLVVFIVTLPTLEQSIHVLLPVGKTSKAQDDKKKVVSITVDSLGKIFVGETPTTRDDLKVTLEKRRGQMQLDVDCGGHHFGYQDEELPETFYAGIT